LLNEERVIKKASGVDSGAESIDHMLTCHGGVKVITAGLHVLQLAQNTSDVFLAKPTTQSLGMSPAALQLPPCQPNNLSITSSPRQTPSLRVSST
jgi:hypothetical protein